jgi:hypothetical protein
MFISKTNFISLLSLMTALVGGCAVNGADTAATEGELGKLNAGEYSLGVCVDSAVLYAGAGVEGEHAISSDTISSACATAAKAWYAAKTAKTATDPGKFAALRHAAISSCASDIFPSANATLVTDAGGYNQKLRFTAPHGAGAVPTRWQIALKGAKRTKADTVALSKGAVSYQEGTQTSKVRSDYNTLKLDIASTSTTPGCKEGDCREIKLSGDISFGADQTDDTITYSCANADPTKSALSNERLLSNYLAD